MSDYISKSAVFAVMSDVFNSYGNNALNFDEEETKAIKRFCAMLQSQIAELPSVDEKEIIRKHFFKVVNQLNGLMPIQFNGFGKTLITVEDVIKILKEECGINE